MQPNLRVASGSKEPKENVDILNTLKKRGVVYDTSN